MIKEALNAKFGLPYFAVDEALRDAAAVGIHMNISFTACYLSMAFSLNSSTAVGIHITRGTLDSLAGDGLFKPRYTVPEAVWNARNSERMTERQPPLLFVQFR